MYIHCKDSISLFIQSVCYVCEVCAKLALQEAEQHNVIVSLEYNMCISILLNCSLKFDIYSAFAIFLAASMILSVSRYCLS